MSRYQIHRDLDQTLAELEQFANRRTGPRSTPIRRADPVHNDLLRDAYQLKPAGELGAALAMVACALILTVVLIEMLVAR